MSQRSGSRRDRTKSDKALIKNKKWQVFIQASLTLNKEIRRASEQTSPQVACAVGHPAMGQDGGLSSGSLLNPPLPFWGRKYGTNVTE